jgi:hypothetical protein
LELFRKKLVYDFTDAGWCMVISLGFVMLVAVSVAMMLVAVPVMLVAVPVMLVAVCFGGAVVFVHVCDCCCCWSWSCLFLLC